MYNCLHDRLIVRKVHVVSRLLNEQKSTTPPSANDGLKQTILT